MKAIDIPARLQEAFTQDVTGRNAIPLTSGVAGQANFAEGFPPETRTPLAAGGTWPDGKDMNGILYLLSAINTWDSAGGLFTFDPTYATAIGGYPKGAAVAMADLSGVWISKIDDNTTDPASNTANWFPLAGTDFASIALTNVNVTLTPAQYSKRILVLTGSLTGNVQVFYPNIPGQYLLVDNTTRNGFSVTAKVTGGAGVGVGLMTGPNFIFPKTDGSDMQYVVVGVAAATQTETNQGIKSDVFVSPLTLRFGFGISLSSSKSYIKFPQWCGGLLIQWGTASIGAGMWSGSVTLLQAYTGTTTYAVVASASGPSTHGSSMNTDAGASRGSASRIDLWARDYDAADSITMYWITVGT